jgi:hypothetical protein
MQLVKLGIAVVLLGTVAAAQVEPTHDKAAPPPTASKQTRAGENHHKPAPCIVQPCQTRAKRILHQSEPKAKPSPDKAPADKSISSSFKKAALYPIGAVDSCNSRSLDSNVSQYALEAEKAINASRQRLRGL